MAGAPASSHAVPPGLSVPTSSAASASAVAAPVTAVTAVSAVSAVSVTASAGSPPSPAASPAGSASAPLASASASGSAPLTAGGGCSSGRREAGAGGRERGSHGWRDRRCGTSAAHTPAGWWGRHGGGSGGPRSTGRAENTPRQRQNQRGRQRIGGKERRPHHGGWPLDSERAGICSIRGGRIQNFNDSMTHYFKDTGFQSP